MPAHQAACLNCGAQLTGPFCGQCGQRAAAADPTMRELVRDVWQEISGWDGRVARSFRALLGHPGVITVETLAGRRARYVSPVRLYLVASITYFLLAAVSPHVGRPRTAQLPGPDRIRINMLDARGVTPQQRAAVERNLARAPWWTQAMLRPILADPVKFRRDFLDTFARVLFVLVPVFAAIVALFYRRRRFPQHLVFALHLHAAIFSALAIGKLAAFTQSALVKDVADAATLIFVVAYVLLSSRRVYGERWLLVVLKTSAISVCYLCAGLLGLLAAVAITAFA